MPKQTQSESSPKRKRLDKRRDRTAANWQLFVKLIGRKAQRGIEPNDRKHSVRVDRKLRRMRPVLSIMIYEDREWFEKEVEEIKARVGIRASRS